MPRKESMLKFLGILALVLGACQGTDDPVVAKIGKRTITLQEYERMATKLLEGPFQKMEKVDREAKETLLGTMIAKELLLAEGMAREFDREPAIANQLISLTNRLLLRKLHDRQTEQLGEPDEVEVEDFFHSSGYEEEIQLSHIMCATEADAERILEELNQGGDFEALAAHHSTHRPSRERRGNYGHVSRAEMLSEIVDLIFDLDPGTIYPQPLRTRFGFHIFRVGERREVDFQQRKGMVAAVLKNKKRGERIAAYGDSLRRVKKLECNSGVMQLLLETTADVPDVALCEWEGGTLSVAKYRQILVSRRESLPVDSEALRQSAEGAAGTQMQVAEARRLGFHQEEGLREQVKKRRDELVIEKLRNQEVGNIEVSEGEMLTYFEENKEQYGPRPIVDVQEILVNGEELASQLRKRIEAGENMEMLSDRYNLRMATQARHGRMWLMRRENFILGQLAPMALDAELGVLHGPLEVPGGYSIFRAIERQERPAQTFEQVQRGIDAMLKARGRGQMLDAFINRLKKQHADIIEIFPEVLDSALEGYDLARKGKEG
jgi:peptidyl-prolyl cis-trans isomerase C